MLRDIKYDDLFSLLQFMYNGEVNVAQDQLNSFLKSAESLKIRGLTDNDSGGGSSNEESRTAPPAPAPNPVEAPKAGAVEVLLPKVFWPNMACCSLGQMALYVFDI